MHIWIVETEYVACLLIAILLFYTLYERDAVSRRTREFRRCLLLSLFAIGFNILGIYFIENAARLPMPLNHCVQLTYFALSILSVYVLCRYVILIIYENAERAAERRRVLIALGALTIAYIAFIALNPITHALYYYDAQYQYIRGPLNRTTYAYFLLLILAVVVSYLRMRKHADESVGRLIGIAIPTTVVLAFLQMMFPDTMFNGTAMAVTLLVIFINLQQMRVNSDYLTMLRNRPAFRQSLETLVGKKRPFYALIVDLEDFRLVNARFGQQGGDRFLRAIARYLNGVGQPGMVYRLRSDEFALIFSAVSPEVYAAWLRQIIARFEEPWRDDELEHRIGARFADIVYPDCPPNTDEIIESLEYALHCAKSGQSERYQRFDKRLRMAYERQAHIRVLIRASLEKGGFRLCYQPLWSIADNAFVGAEVLLRLRDTDSAPVSPSEFIPIAEESGQVSDLGWMVIDKALSFLAQRPADTDFVTVNIAAVQFLEPDFARNVEQALRAHGLASSRLKLEVTERVVAKDAQRFAQAIGDLKALGVGVLLDDFGTGYSNLFLVSRLPFECVKFDHSLISDIESNVNVLSVLRAFIDGLKHSGTQILIEGVERESQHALVLTLGADFLQGYFVALPMEEEPYYKTVAGTPARTKGASDAQTSASVSNSGV